MKMKTMYRSPEEAEFYAKLKARRAAAPKVEYEKILVKMKSA